MTRLIIAVLLLSAAPLSAQPRVTNGSVQAAALTNGLTRGALDALAAKSGTAWLAYAVPILPGERWICDGITDGNVQINRAGTGSDVMMLEGGRLLHVLFRLDDGRVDRIRLASETCTLDAGGLTVLWVADVSPADSVVLLSTFLTPSSTRRVANGALTALAMHQEPAALDRLLLTARDGATPQLRGQALFWLAQRAGEKAVGAISAAIENDPETEVKKRAVFALSQLPKDEGVPRLIEVARGNNNPAVRRQAMFWLGQSRDPRAVKFFQDILFK
jgi:hypothetical protein